MLAPGHRSARSDVAGLEADGECRWRENPVDACDVHADEAELECGLVERSMPAGADCGLDVGGDSIDSCLDVARGVFCHGQRPGGRPQTI